MLHRRFVRCDDIEISRHVEEKLKDIRLYLDDTSRPRVCRTCESLQRN